ncbi:MAG: RsmD family RNA methyltransferase [Flavobacteriaceae bacterium]|nr:RsmD family RNA methyltransferase [Flavobacteriaceae bacterium]
MRIVSGTHKGRRINAPKNLPVRPTTDMSKEALFNILNNTYYFDEITVLDLFSGIGSISLEFASRGTKIITSVDMHSGCVNFLNKTASTLNFDIQTIKSDVFKFLENTIQKYDIIFADPPYAFSEEQYITIYKQIFDKNLLKKNGLLILEHSKKIKLSHLDYFEKLKKYGSNRFSFFDAVI